MGTPGSGKELALAEVEEKKTEEKKTEERKAGPRENRGGGPPRSNDRGGPPDRGRDLRGGPGGRGPGDRRPEMAPEMDIEKLIADPLYLDNQAHVVVSRMRDMDSGTKSQLRRLYNAVRRATRAPESERQHEFVMVRARLAYTIARHSLRSLDALERLLLQVTRKNDTRGYERFRDLFEAIIAYNE
jgi:CRISPR type III-A-associated protein Csm2